MDAFWHQLQYYLTHPQAVIYGVASALLYPVLVIEVIALFLVLFEAGRFSIEMFYRWRARRRIDVEATAKACAAAPTEPGPVLAMLRTLRNSPVGKRVLASFGGGEDLSRSRVLKALADGELEASKVLERTRILVRFGPILGLMGTLIPISPALVGLASGDVKTLSDNLVIAFSTTVVGLLVGGLAYVVTTIRDRMYRQDVVDLEYVFDRLEV